MSHGARLFTFPPSESSGFSWSWRLNAGEDTFAHLPARTPVRFPFPSEGRSWYLRAGIFPFISSSRSCSDFFIPAHRPPHSGFPPASWWPERSALAEEEECGRCPGALGHLGPLFLASLRVFMCPQYHLRAKCLSPVTCLLKSGVSPPQYPTQGHLEF